MKTITVGTVCKRYILHLGIGNCLLQPIGNRMVIVLNNAWVLICKSNHPVKITPIICTKNQGLLLIYKEKARKYYNSGTAFVTVPLGKIGCLLAKNDHCFFFLFGKLPSSHASNSARVDLPTGSKKCCIDMRKNCKKVVPQLRICVMRHSTV